MKTTVVNLRTTPYDVYIGRGSKWGNPFKIGPDGGRAVVVAKYALYVADRPELLKALGELRGKRLGCYCAPAACHGGILAALADVDKEGI